MGHATQCARATKRNSTVTVTRRAKCLWLAHGERDLVKKADVNLRHRILTIAFLIAFVATVIWCPWRCDGFSHFYSPLWIPPCEFGGSSIVWPQLLTEWIGLAGVYAGLRAVLK
jgi:hypothetical protein